ncbi:MAG: hypothetical protein HYU81_02170 [Candidatus Brennerbacteria bacterium]|nr:hypothetical protein [Candidatus Brennerbacteria bacterium]
MVTFVILAALALIFGAYLPFIKARGYITSINTLASVNSLESFYAHFDRLLLHPSPVGQEEAVKYLGSDIANFISAEDQPEPVARAIVAYLEPYLFRNNVRHLLMGGQFYETLWRRFGQQEADLRSAEAYYLAARAIGPKLPPVLYSLYDLYGTSEQLEKRAEVRDAIIRLWPEEVNRLE